MKNYHQAKWAERNEEKRNPHRTEKRVSEQDAAANMTPYVRWCIENFDQSTGVFSQLMEVRKYVSYRSEFRNFKNQIILALDYYARRREIPHALYSTWRSQLDSPDHENWYIALLTIKQHFKL
jgi:hypothetical protein